MQRDLAGTPERHVKLFKNGQNQALRIPREFELPGDDAIMRKEGDRLIMVQVGLSELLRRSPAFSAAHLSVASAVPINPYDFCGPEHRAQSVGDLAKRTYEFMSATSVSLTHHLKNNKSLTISEHVGMRSRG